MKAIDIMHRQMQHLIVLLIELAKLANEQQETRAQKDKKRGFIFEQCKTVRDWIMQFKPDNINYD